MSRFNISPDEDSTGSSNSNEYGYPECTTKKAPIISQYQDMDPESQNFLPDYHLGKKKYETEYSPGTTSFGMSVFNLGNAIMGSGILGLSYAMANTGIALFAGKDDTIYSVTFLRERKLKGNISFFLQSHYTLKNYGSMSSYLYIVKYELPIVIQAFLGMKENTGEWYINGDYLVLTVSLLIILPLSLLRNLGYLGYTSGFSLLCMVFFVIVVIYKTFQISCSLIFENDALNATLNYTVAHVTAAVRETAVTVQNATADEDTCTTKYFVWNSQTVYAVPILTFAFVCHPAVLPIYEELKDRSRKRMQNVSNVSFFAMFVMYLLAALFGYITFGNNVEPELLHTYSKVYKFDVVLLIVRLAVLTAVTLTVPVVLFPIRTSVNQLLCASKEFSWVRHTIITFVLLGFTNILVIFVPTIRDIFGFVGASAAAMLIFILPSAFYIKLVKKESIKSVQKIGAVIFCISGFFVMIGSMTLIILDWTQNAAMADGH
ncbi:UNVERIFIED_CONTAM: hypothetical protein FKN15_069944 [Acipenser sinensis]